MEGVIKYIMVFVISVVLVFSLIALAQAKSEFMSIPASAIIVWMLVTASLLDIKNI